MAFQRKLNTTPKQLAAAKRLQREFLKKAGHHLKLMREMFECTDYCFYVKDLSGRIMLINSANCRISNFPNELAVVGHPSSDLFPPAFAADYMDADRRVLETGKPIYSEDSPFSADFSQLFFRRNVFPVRDDSGRLVGTAMVYLQTRRSAEHDIHRMKKAIEHLELHYAEPYDAALLANELGLSTSQLRRAFSAQYRLSPSEYLTTVRLRHALELIESTDLTLAEIATACGFYDQAHFTRVFKRSRGITPAAYRRQHR